MGPNTHKRQLLAGGHAVNSKRYRSQLAQTTDDHLRYEFLRLLAQEGRQHFMRQIAEENFGDFADAKVVPLVPR
jgi:hypothetical protein